MQSENTEKENLFSDKQIHFINQLVTKGVLDVKELAEEMKVSRQTIYNYYFALKNLVFERKKGKILLYERGPDTYLKRFAYNKEVKDKLADYVVGKYINNYDTIFLDCGSSTLHIADQILEKELTDLTIITTNPYVLQRLINYKKLRELLVIGGIVNADSGAFWGPWTNTLLDHIEYQFQKAFLGIDGIQLQGSELHVMVSNTAELDQKSKVISKSGEIYIVFDDSKIDRGGNALFSVSKGRNALFSGSKEKAGEIKNIRYIVGHNDGGEMQKITEIQNILGNKLEIVSLENDF